MAHVKNSKLLTIGTLAPLHRSLWQHLISHSVTFTFKKWYDSLATICVANRFVDTTFQKRLSGFAFHLYCHMDFITAVQPGRTIRIVVRNTFIPALR